VRLLQDVNRWERKKEECYEKRRKMGEERESERVKSIIDIADDDGREQAAVIALLKNKKKRKSCLSRSNESLAKMTLKCSNPLPSCPTQCLGTRKFRNFDEYVTVHIIIYIYRAHLKGFFLPLTIILKSINHC
jgi:hypothetical protein